MADDQHSPHPEQHPSEPTAHQPYPPHGDENQYYDYQQGGYVSAVPVGTQSKMGTASLITGIFALLLGVAGQYIGWVMVKKYPDLQNMTPGQTLPEDILSLAFSACGSMFGSFILSIIGLILGITVWINPVSRKGFAILGVVLNGLTLALWMLLIVVIAVQFGKT